VSTAAVEAAAAGGVVIDRPMDAVNSRVRSGV
jgi:hypothetical protein